LYKNNQKQMISKPRTKPQIIPKTLTKNSNQMGRPRQAEDCHKLRKTRMRLESRPEANYFQAKAKAMLMINQ
jgi:hypothetical protein